MRHANLVYFSETKGSTNFRSRVPSLRAHTDIEKTSTHTSSKAQKEKLQTNNASKVSGLVSAAKYPTSWPPCDARRHQAKTRKKKN